jgi:hypothetical protein
MTLPRWEAHNERDAMEMTRWVNDELNKQDIEALRKDMKGESDYESWAMQQADNHVSIGPLRKAFPNLARFLQFPVRKPGSRLPERGFSPVKGAVADVGRIRDLWAKHYPGKRRMTAPSAESVAAERWQIETDTVINALKK